MAFMNRSFHNVSSANFLALIDIFELQSKNKLVSAKPYFPGFSNCDPIF